MVLPFGHILAGGARDGFLEQPVRNDLFGDLERGEDRHPVFQQVDSVRANVANRFSRITRPEQRRVHLPLVNLRRPSSVDWKRFEHHQHHEGHRDHQPPVSANRSLMLTSSCVMMGSSTSSLKHGQEFGQHVGLEEKHDRHPVTATNAG